MAADRKSSKNSLHGCNTLSAAASEGSVEPASLHGISIQEFADSMIITIWLTDKPCNPAGPWT
eukprot:482823-Lingulodinium_polyedra.AAC.1